MVRICCLFLFLSIYACTEESSTLPDISSLSIDFEVKRFEYDLDAAAKLSDQQNGAVVLRKDYPVFFDSIWLDLLVPTNAAGYDSALVSVWDKQPILRKLLDSVLQEFPKQDSKWENDLKQAFLYAKHYFPDEPTPTVVSYPSELTLGAFTYGDSLLGIGLDFFLGAGFSAYDPNVFPRYIQRSMNKDHVVPVAIEAWLGNMLGEDAGDRMLDIMINNGKIMYVKKQLMPMIADTAVFGFSKDQLQWLRENELQIWAHYLDKELLYETKSALIIKHIGPSPNAPGMPPEAPGGNANWMGMQIVDQYMKRFPNKTLKDLILTEDSQQLLSDSKYKPKR